MPLRGRGPVVGGCSLACAWVPLKTKPLTLGTSRAGPGSMSCRGPCTCRNQPPRVPGSSKAHPGGKDGAGCQPECGGDGSGQDSSGMWPAGALLLPWLPFPHLCKDPQGSRETRPPCPAVEHPPRAASVGGAPRRDRSGGQMGNGWGQSAAQLAAHPPPAPPTGALRLGGLTPTWPAGHWTQTGAFGPFSSLPCVY